MSSKLIWLSWLKFSINPEIAQYTIFFIYYLNILTEKHAYLDRIYLLSYHLDIHSKHG